MHLTSALEDKPFMHHNLDYYLGKDKILVEQFEEAVQGNTNIAVKMLIQSDDIDRKQILNFIRLAIKWRRPYVLETLIQQWMEKHSDHFETCLRHLFENFFFDDAGKLAPEETVPENTHRFEFGWSGTRLCMRILLGSLAPTLSIETTALIVHECSKAKKKLQEQAQELTDMRQETKLLKAGWEKEREALLKEARRDLQVAQKAQKESEALLKEAWRNLRVARKAQKIQEALQEAKERELRREIKSLEDAQKSAHLILAEREADQRIRKINEAERQAAERAIAVWRQDDVERRRQKEFSERLRLVEIEEARRLSAERAEQSTLQHRSPKFVPILARLKDLSAYATQYHDNDGMVVALGWLQEALAIDNCPEQQEYITLVYKLAVDLSKRLQLLQPLIDHLEVEGGLHTDRASAPNSTCEYTSAR